MFTIPMPLQSIAVKTTLAVIVLVAVALAAFANGHSLAKAKGEAVVADIKAQYAAAIADATQEARRKEQDLRLDIDAIQAKYARLEEVAAREANELNTLVSDLRAGTRRLSIRVQNCAATSGSAPDTAIAGGGGTGDTQRAELDPETAEDLIGIARDGDRFIRERNACVEAYESVRRSLSGQ